MNPILIHTDGGARGNPGPAALGVVIDLGPKGVKEYAEFLGTKTNNEAEYLAIIFALRKTKALVGKEKAKKAHLVVHTDSELVTHQISGTFKVMNKEFYPLFMEIWNVRQDFAKVDFVNVAREKNRKADALVNRALDEQGKPRKLF